MATIGAEWLERHGGLEPALEAAVRRAGTFRRGELAELLDAIHAAAGVPVEAQAAAPAPRSSTREVAPMSALHEAC